MKVLLLNGSPHKQGCTYTALAEIQKTLKECGIDSDIFQIGNDPIIGCRACGACAKLGKCAINDCCCNNDCPFHCFLFQLLNFSTFQRPSLLQTRDIAKRSRNLEVRG